MKQKFCVALPDSARSGSVTVAVPDFVKADSMRQWQRPKRQRNAIPLQKRRGEWNGWDDDFSELPDRKRGAGNALNTF